jgi:OOP family OmpA-OmpF porin
MKKNILIALFAAAAVAPVAAQAQAYVGASVGRADQKLTIEDVGTVKENDTSYKVFGGYQFTKNIGVEAAYADLGTATITGGGETVDSNPKMFTAAVTGTVPVTGAFSATGKIGFARTNTTVSAFGVGEEKIKHTSPLLGLGVSFAVTPKIAIVAEYEHFFNIIKEGEGKLKASNLSAGVRFNF